ncbi:Protein N-acetyltransferase, RimJ/RimL family [Actinokineospora alba]|uniref:Protein N-acetyltransferase, RimJ/RimL family n=1 Tax=Actinokineospora alba TaxID=504798 RepID=A0A1H0RP01_9PSEU|nr:GNAT family N-acetyltransferase [Actinokineospora alba]TDP67006.1 RimJ/RimL family protein N-acetyltransferase [Actinokineospora alba]SDJ31843.1 Protein N-acetyltransferase, RimJ/RimL family [Actinokineospora alba]SDP30686.1 Protein N-acetyltransferase, RimJ/RimL family [Actinokineospora alba]
MREIEVRQATADDWMELRAIRVAALTADPSAFGATLTEESGYDEARWRSWPESCGVFLATLDGEPVAIAGGKPDSDDVELISVWARPTLRGTGAGEAVVRAVIDWARGRRAGRITAWATEGNDRALRFYRRLGFIPTGRDDAHPHDPALRELEVALPLA